MQTIGSVRKWAAKAMANPGRALPRLGGAMKIIMSSAGEEA